MAILHCMVIYLKNVEDGLNLETRCVQFAAKIAQLSEHLEYAQMLLVANSIVGSNQIPGMQREQLLAYVFDEWR